MQLPIEISYYTDIIFLFLSESCKVWFVGIGTINYSSATEFLHGCSSAPVEKGSRKSFPKRNTHLLCSFRLYICFLLSKGKKKADNPRLYLQISLVLFWSECAWISKSITLCLVNVKIAVNRFHFTAEFPVFLRQMYSLRPVCWGMVAQTFGFRFCKLKYYKSFAASEYKFCFVQTKKHAEFFSSVYGHKKFNLGL